MNLSFRLGAAAALLAGTLFLSPSQGQEAPLDCNGHQGARGVSARSLERTAVACATTYPYEELFAHFGDAKTGPWQEIADPRYKDIARVKESQATFQKLLQAHPSEPLRIYHTHPCTPSSTIQPPSPGDLLMIITEKHFPRYADEPRPMRQFVADCTGVWEYRVSQDLEEKILNLLMTDAFMEGLSPLLMDRAIQEIATLIPERYNKKVKEGYVLVIESTAEIPAYIETLKKAGIHLSYRPQKDGQILPETKEEEQIPSP